MIAARKQLTKALKIADPDYYEDPQQSHANTVIMNDIAILKVYAPLLDDNKKPSKAQRVEEDQYEEIDFFTKVDGKDEWAGTKQGKLLDTKKELSVCNLFCFSPFRCVFKVLLHLLFTEEAVAFTGKSCTRRISSESSSPPPSRPRSRSCSSSSRQSGSSSPTRPRG